MFIAMLGIAGAILHTVHQQKALLKTFSQQATKTPYTFKVPAELSLKDEIFLKFNYASANKLIQIFQRAQSALEQSLIILLMLFAGILSVLFFITQKLKAREFKAVRDAKATLETNISLQKQVNKKERAAQLLHELSIKQKHLATHDTLTGLPNRQLFEDRLKQAISISERYDKSFALLFLDLDGFKNINDSLGHDYGDNILIETSKRLETCLRATDTLARIGGDEFTVIVTNLANPKFAATVAKKMMKILSTPFEVKQQQLFITTSIGISIYPLDSKNATALIKHADTAMYHAKDSGRNIYRYYTEEMNTAALRQLTLSTDLHYALDNQELFLTFQPQINAYTNQLIGVESLIRWEHPNLGLISPAEFIPLAENNGMIGAIGLWVFEQTCLQGKKWIAQGFKHILLSINVSARQFNEASFLPSLKEIIKRTNISPRYLDIEITESTLVSDHQQTIEVIQELRAMGMKISIDDFGTGYASLSYLKNFPFDILKIDRSFIQEISESTSTKNIVQAIIAIAKSLQVEIIAEGVEHAEEKDILLASGCQIMQGYYFSRPITAQACDVFLKAYQ